MVIAKIRRLNLIGCVETLENSTTEYGNISPAVDKTTATIDTRKHVVQGHVVEGHVHVVEETAVIPRYHW